MFYSVKNEDLIILPTGCYIEVEVFLKYDNPFVEALFYQRDCDNYFNKIVPTEKTGKRCIFSFIPSEILDFKVLVESYDELGKKNEDLRFYISIKK